MLVYVPLNAPKPDKSFNDILGLDKIFNDIKKVFNDMKSYHDNGKLTDSRWNPFISGESFGNLTFTGANNWDNTSGTGVINFNDDTTGTFTLADIYGGKNRVTADRVDHNITSSGERTVTVTGRVIS